MYKEKYLKYKTKYLDLKSQEGGVPNILQEGGYFFWEGKNEKKAREAAEAAAAEKAAAEKAVAEKAVAEAAAAKAAAEVAAEKAAKVAEMAAEVVAAEINDKSKSSVIFANAYKNQHTTSRKLQFYFKIDKIVKRSTHFNGKRRESNEKINVILLNHYFIYDNMNIYMSSNQYSPLSYKEYFTRNIQNINTFFTNFIELLIYIELFRSVL